MIRQLAGPATRGQMDLPGNRIAVWEARRFFIRPASACPQPAEPFLYRLDRPGTVSIRETGGLLQVKKVRLSSRNRVQGVPSGRAVVDWDKIRWPLIIRSLRPGDRFRPLGLGGTKKVSRFFQDRKVPRADRSRLPLIWSGGDLVWIAGMEVGQPFAVEEGSRLGLQLTYRPWEEKVFETNHR
jgi:tRNA(Ile)-lysidine synthase